MTDLIQLAHVIIREHKKKIDKFKTVGDAFKLMDELHPELDEGDRTLLALNIQAILSKPMPRGLK